jgi:uncharacterized protein YlaN (UPF0358 family)
MNIEEIGNGLKSVCLLVEEVMEEGMSRRFSLKPFNDRIHAIELFATKLSRIENSEGAALISRNIREIVRNLRIHSKKPFKQEGEMCRSEIERNLYEMHENIMKL